MLRKYLPRISIFFRSPYDIKPSFVLNCGVPQSSYPILPFCTVTYFLPCKVLPEGKLVSGVCKLQDDGGLIGSNNVNVFLLYAFFVSGGNYTLFAPTNDAFNALAGVLPDITAPGAKDTYSGKDIDEV